MVKLYISRPSSVTELCSACNQVIYGNRFKVTRVVLSCNDVSFEQLVHALQLFGLRSLPKLRSSPHCCPSNEPPNAKDQNSLYCRSLCTSPWSRWPCIWFNHPYFSFRWIKDR